MTEMQKIRVSVDTVIDPYTWEARMDEENGTYVITDYLGKGIYRVDSNRNIIFDEEKAKQYEMKKMRQRREDECFSIINRGQFWHDTLTEQQKYELRTWYKAWLDVTTTKQIPQKPSWLV